MVNSLILPQETITSFQERIKILEKCLNSANPQDEIIAEIIELENSGLISLSKLIEDVIQLRYKLNKVIKLVNKLKENPQPDQLSVLLFVRYNFLIKEILDQCSEFSFIKNNKLREVFIDLILAALNTYKIIKKEASSLTYPQDETYTLAETRKHVIKSIIKVSVQFDVLTEDFVKSLDIEEDITPKESEAMLISLASTKKWDWVYRNLA
ncbi:hypothetical protein IQ259_22300 [Fortiea sp. LEGE XX443]|uniref:hypothetical protein n=1 Tax=Fortiea sp. LEGE XX443 TaxID=1828611 RepID=UPI0019DA23B3|nr:hypothetical protein [Fortiea sp. LEGE XX443]